MQKFLFPLLVMLIALSLSLWNTHAERTTQEKNVALRTPIDGVLIVAPTSKVAEAFLNRCRDLFAQDRTHATSLHGDYLLESQPGIDEMGNGSRSMELILAMNALDQFKLIGTPTHTDHTNLCLSLEPIMIGSYSAR